MLCRVFTKYAAAEGFSSLIFGLGLLGLCVYLAKFRVVWTVWLAKCFDLLHY